MNDNNIAEKITKLRKEKGLTQSQLAALINVSNKTISRWETGEGYPEISLLLPLAKALGVTTDYLLGAACEQETPAQTPASGENQPQGSAAGRGEDTGSKESRPHKHGNRPTEPFSLEPRKLYRCCRSLTIFNKIGVWCAGLSLLTLFLSLAFMTCQINFVRQLLPLLIMVLPKIGIGSTALGFILGLADLYDKQAKAALVIAAANLIIGYVLPVLWLILCATLL